MEVHRRRTALVAMVLVLTGLAACSPQAATPLAVTPLAAALDGPTAAATQAAHPLTVASRSTTRVLSIKIDYQDHALSCEAAALKMALAYEGIRIDELTLIRYMTDDRRSARFDAQGRLVAWGDPAQAYVGNPDGRIERYTGYGVYNAPVARAAIRAGAQVVGSGSGLYGKGIRPVAVYDFVLAGHPVVVWISNTYHDVPLHRYTAFDGAKVWYTLTEHAVTVIGVRPGGVLINDPWFGQAWHSKAQFESAYETFGNMAVVVGR